MASKFNIGDKVRLTDAYPIGETTITEEDIAMRGTVIEVTEITDYYGKNAFRGDNKCGIYLDDEAELVEKALFVEAAQ